MNIGEAAALSGLPAKTIRYYEDIGLIVPAGRSRNGYRDYSPKDIHVLRFLQRARGLGFTIADCRGLLALYSDRNRASADVKAVALQRIASVEQKIAELRTIRAALAELAERCAGDHRPDCPIIEDLAGVLQDDVLELA